MSATMADYGLQGRLLLVSNRLPISIKRSDDGSISMSMSGGGLVTGLAGLSESESFRWFGWPGLQVPMSEVPKFKRQLKDEFNAVPVVLDEELSDKHLNGFSNSIMWPLFHYHPSEINFDEEAWAAYKEANRIFARTISQEAQDGDMIWIHDYHLMLVPKYLREELGERANKVKIGFFLHIPFPASEVFRILPVRTEILHGVIESDLVGFQTYDYVRHFLSSCGRLLGLDTTPTEVHTRSKRVVKVGAFGIGIDPGKIAHGLEKPKVRERIRTLQGKFQGMKLILGVDRLDYIKGIPQKLHAFEVFLTEHPEWVGKMVLIQVAVPSRQDVEEYQNLRSVVNELVGRINGKFGSIEYTPIHFIHQSVPFDELIALYAVSDTCVVTSTRDGMNLVSYEYIAAQVSSDDNNSSNNTHESSAAGVAGPAPTNTANNNSNTGNTVSNPATSSATTAGTRRQQPAPQQTHHQYGVMLLSEFTGAAQCLNGSLVFNPWNTEELAACLHEAVTMSDDLRRANWEKLIAHVRKYTSAYWAKSFIKELSGRDETRAEASLPLRPGES